MKTIDDCVNFKIAALKQHVKQFLVQLKIPDYEVTRNLLKIFSKDNAFSNVNTNYKQMRRLNRVFDYIAP
jgi:hypothetical protein